MLADGQSEIDSVVVRLPDSGIVIKSWDNYQVHSQFLVPTAGWSFTMSDQDVALLDGYLVPGCRVELAINDAVQCTGRVDRKTVTTDGSSGTSVTIQGRDILGPVVDSCVDPIFRFTSGMTIVDVVAAILKPFGITVIENSDLANVNAITGFAKGKGPASTTEKSVTADVRNGTFSDIAGTNVTTISSANRPDLKTLTVEQCKPHVGEGCFAYLDRLLKRLGLTMWARADGSGVVIDQADFSTAPQATITHVRTGDTSANNVKHGSLVTDLTTQPSCIVAFGFGGGKDVQKSKLVCIMVNELTGTIGSNPLPEIGEIIARYKGAHVLPIRSTITPLRSYGTFPSKPLFVKDDEAKNFAQLEAFTRRTMAEHQRKAIQLSYDLEGHTFNDHPWAVNTNIAVNDPVLGVTQTMWCVEREFQKGFGSGTISRLKLILPHTLSIGA